MGYTINDFAMLTPMRYYNNEDASNQKRKDMIENKDKQYIATKKNDGDWSMLIHYSKGNNLIRSRSISKVTGVYGDYTAKVPHIVEEMDNWPDNTVVLAELCWDQDGTNANTVGTILRCLPAKAVERQKENKLKAVIFDMLMVDGKDLTGLGYFFRLEEVLLFPRGLYTYPTEVITQDFAEAADRIIAGGGEGVVIQRCDYPYSPGNRTAWKTLKLKQQLPEMELKVVGVLEPKKFYEGDCPDTWEYKLVERYPVIDQFGDITSDYYEDEVLVTKPYYYGWKNGITVELPSGIKTDVTSGLTDYDREWLATETAAKMIEAGELFAVIKCMSFNDLGKLRHASLIRLRNDM